MYRCFDIRRQAWGTPQIDVLSNTYSMVMGIKPIREGTPKKSIHDAITIDYTTATSVIMIITVVINF